jgi:AP-3 complex subunit beta
MLRTLIVGISPGSLDEDAQEERGGVKLRREQVRLILFDGKAGVVETAEFTGKGGPY